jgi:hypothetical protein
MTCKRYCSLRHWLRRAGVFGEQRPERDGSEPDEKCTGRTARRWPTSTPFHNPVLLPWRGAISDPIARGAIEVIASCYRVPPTPA